jgi:hypothetical protein
MATIAQRLTTKDVTVAVRQAGQRRTINDPELSDAVRRAYILWRRLKTLEAELSEAKGLIARRAEELGGGGSTISFGAGDVTCTITSRHEALIPEENVVKLKKLLGRRFKDLVRTKVRYLATCRLVEEAGNEALSLMRLRRLSPQFKWGTKGASNSSS